VLVFLGIWFYLAPRNLWFTFVKEGTAKIVVKGGEFKKVLIQWKDHTLDKEWNVIDGEEPWHLFGGLRYYGFWPVMALYSYRFQWSGVTENGDIQHHPKEWFDYILLKDDVYWFKVEKAEDRDLLPLDVEMVVTLKAVNPYRALFRIQSWLETVINRTRPAVRDIVGEKRFKEMINHKEELGGEVMKILTDRGLLKEFRDDYGIEIKKVQIKEINPPEIYQEATLKQYLAKRERERIVIEADAEKRKLETIAKGEKARIKTVYEEIQKFGDLGKLVRAVEAMEKSPLAASVTVQAVPGIQELLGGIFGKSTDNITAKELRMLRGMLGRLLKEKEENQKGS